MDYRSYLSLIGVWAHTRSFSHLGNVVHARKSCPYNRRGTGNRPYRIGGLIQSVESYLGLAGKGGIVPNIGKIGLYLGLEIGNTRRLNDHPSLISSIISVLWRVRALCLSAAVNRVGHVKKLRAIEFDVLVKAVLDEIGQIPAFLGFLPIFNCSNS